MAAQSDFNIVVDGLPYIIRATPQLFNSQVQYRVSINQGDEILFAFTPSLGRYAPVGDDAIDVPDTLEMAIGDKLNGQ